VLRIDRYIGVILAHVIPFCSSLELKRSDRATIR